MTEKVKENKHDSYENYLINKVGVDLKLLEQGKEKAKDWTKYDWDKYHDDTNTITKKFVDALVTKAKPNSKEVQNIVREHFNLVKIFWTPNKNSYIGLGHMYSEYADFKNFYDSYHPELTIFLVKAMTIFAENELS